MSSAESSPKSPASPGRTLFRSGRASSRLGSCLQKLGGISPRRLALPLQVLPLQTKRETPAFRECAGAKLADLRLKAVLGKGSFGCVRLAMHKDNNTPCAVKQMHKCGFSRPYWKE